MKVFTLCFEYFKPIQAMHMKCSFISIKSFKYFMCSCSCWPGLELTAPWHQGTKEQCICKRNTEACLQNHCCHEKVRSITYSLCVSVALVIQHAKCMHRIILSPMACLVLPYFSTLSHKWQKFWEVIENKILFFLQLLSEKSYFKKKSARYFH